MKHDDATRTAQTHTALLRDWDDPTINEAELCERHGLTPDRLRDFAARPDFARDVETLRAVRRMRRPDVESRSRELVRSSLCALVNRDPASAAQARETRLAIKQLLAVLDEPDAPDAPDPAGSARPARTPPAPSGTSLPEPAPGSTRGATTRQPSADRPRPGRAATRPRNTPRHRPAAGLLAAAGVIPTI